MSQQHQLLFWLATACSAAYGAYDQQPMLLYRKLLRCVQLLVATCYSSMYCLTRIYAGDFLQAWL